MSTVQPLRPYAQFTDETGRLTTEGYDFLYNIFLRVGGSLSSLNAVTLLTYDWNSPGTIGATAPSTGKFTTLTATGHTTFEGVTSTGATGTGKLVYNISPTFTTPILGTPTSGVATNLTGTAAGLTAGNVTTNANLTGMVTSVGNATTVVTNANLTGVITSTGNATSIASQTGTGTKFVVDTAPTLVTPVIGVATGTSLALSGGFGCNTKTAQTAYASGGSVSTTASTNTSPYGYTTAAQADAIITKLNNVIAALVANGIMS